MPAKAFLDDSDFESYWIQSSSGSEGDFLRKKYEFQWWHVLLAGFFLFPFISIFILFGISGTTIDNKENILDLSTAISTDFNTRLSFNSIGTPLSFSELGASSFNQGGGTSLYLNTLSENLEAPCPSYSSLVSMNKNGFFLGSYSFSENKGMLLTFLTKTDTKVATTKMTDIKTFIEVEIPIRKIISLSSTSSDFVTLSYDETLSTDNSRIISGSVSSYYDIDLKEDNSIDFTSSKLPDLISLDNNKFILLYQSLDNSQNNGIFLKLGTFDPTSRSINLGEEYKLIDYTSDSITYSLISFSENQLLFSYYLSSSKYLQSTFISINTDGSFKIGTSINLQNSVLSGNIASSKISSDIAVLTYLNSEQGTIDVIQIKLLDPTEGLISYGPFITLSTFSTQQLDLDISPLSTQGDFLVIFSDSYSFGSLAAICQVTSTQITRISPNINLAISNTGSVKQAINWAAIAPLSSTHLKSRAGILYFESNNKCETSSNIKFLILDRLPLPVGVTNIYKKEKKSEILYHEVSLSGRVANLPVTLVPGKKYYTNSRGELISSSNYYGRTDVFVYNKDSNTVVLEDNLIGIAIDKKVLDVNLFKGRNN